MSVTVRLLKSKEALLKSVEESKIDNKQVLGYLC